MTTFDRAAAAVHIEAADKEVSRLCSSSRKWTMTIPAEPEHDSDLVISRALMDASLALAEIDRLQGAERLLAAFAFNEGLRTGRPLRIPVNVMAALPTGAVLHTLPVDLNGNLTIFVEPEPLAEESTG